jgi:hypothetical protein
MKLLPGDSNSPVYHDGLQFNNNYWTNYNINIYVQIPVLCYSYTGLQHLEGSLALHDWLVELNIRWFIRKTFPLVNL